MAQYLLSVHYVEGEPEPVPDIVEKMYADVDALNQEIQTSGAWVFGGGLEPPSTSTVVKEVNGDIVMTDGPFAEAKEQIGGFWILDVPDLDAALAWASKATVACRGPVDVRPFQALPGE